METYCMKRRKNTKNLNSKIFKTKNCIFKTKEWQTGRLIVELKSQVNGRLIVELKSQDL